MAPSAGGAGAGVLRAAALRAVCDKAVAALGRALAVAG